MRPQIFIVNPDGSYHGRGTLAIDAGGRDWATGSTTMTRTMCDMVRLLERKQQQPADTEAPPLAIEPIPPRRRRPAEPKPAQHPLHREKAPAEDPAEDKDPSKMTGDELNAALKAIRAQATKALFDNKHPNHKDALRLLPEMLPGVIVPKTVE